MKRSGNWQIIFAISLIAASISVYCLDYLIFRDAEHIFIYLLDDIAFSFIQVLLVTLGIHGLLTYREKKAMLKKLNMVIGAFFSEVGTDLIRLFSAFDHSYSGMSKKLLISPIWGEKDFAFAAKEVAGHDFAIECAKGDLDNLKALLVGKRAFMLTLLENPNLLDHESFTNLLWAVFHLTEELASRKSLKGLPEPDFKHLAGDIKRACSTIISEWLAYMAHLKADYPYLYSLAVRTNPFDPNASVEVKA